MHVIFLCGLVWNQVVHRWFVEGIVLVYIHQQYQALFLNPKEEEAGFDL